MNQSTETSTYPAWKTWLAVGLIALVLRGGVLWLAGENLEADPLEYRQITEGLINRTVYGRRTMLAWAPTPYEPTAYLAPVYPMLLANSIERGRLVLWRVALTHLVLGVATSLLAMHLAWCWGLRQFAWLAGILTAAEPVLLWQAVLLTPQTTATFLAVVALYGLTRLARVASPLEASMVGLMLAACVLCQAVFWFWLMMIFPTLFWLSGKWWLRLANVAMLVVTLMVAITPWAARNWIELGRPIVGTTSGGQALAHAHHRERYDEFERSFRLIEDEGADRAFRRAHFRKFQSTPATEAHYDIDLDLAGYQLGIETASKSPGIAARSMAWNFTNFWSPLPPRSSDSEPTRITLLRLAAMAVSSITLLLATVGALTKRDELWRLPWLWGVLLLLSLTLTHTIIWSEPAMRAPLMPVVAIFAAAGVRAIASGLSR